MILPQVHCQISYGKTNNNIRYFANNVTVVDEQGRGNAGGGGRGGGASSDQRGKGGERRKPTGGGDGGERGEKGRPQGQQQGGSLIIQAMLIRCPNSKMLMLYRVAQVVMENLPLT